jgi:type I restriction enzyme S subunit
MVVEKGYKLTEVGVIPEDWEVKRIIDISLLKSGLSITANEISEIGGYSCYGGNGLRGFTKKFTHNGKYPIIGRQGALCGNINYVEGKFFASEHAVVVSVNNQTDAKWLSYVMIRMNLNQYSESSAQPGLSVNKIGILKIPFPLKKNEQTAIANALSDMDALITQTEKLIDKKKAIKQGVMQELLKPKEGWVTKKLGEVCEILDNIRKPLNDSQRQDMKGDIPYCGANGIVGYVNDFLIDDNIILMAEDGGYFDEYKTRPIAYRFTGKCWVNNHVHILKSKKEYDQDFVFYSLVHKNILDFINGGTRAKLNKSEMLNITINIPLNKNVQTKIADTINEIGDYLYKAETKLQKLKNQKQGMMQALLTGKIRLV